MPRITRARHGFCFSISLGRVGNSPRQPEASLVKGWEVMKMEKRILFGVDDSDFSLQEISRFGLGSKANKLLHGAQALVICLVP